MASLAPHALIVGCGYLGRALAARLVKQGTIVFGTCRSMDRAAELAALGVRPLVLAVTQPVTLAALRPALEAPAIDVFYMVPPGRNGAFPSPRQTILGGTAHVLKQLRHASVRSAVLVSSTAVYGQATGERVDANAPPAPADERSTLLLEGERLWRAAGDQFRVLRLAGVYGPGRVIGATAVREGSPLVGNPQALLNLIHVDDAADLLLAIATAESAGPIELGCDGTPVPRLDYYTYLARRLGVALPTVVDDARAAITLGLNLDRLRRASSKALDNIPTCRRTGWSPRYPHFRLGLEACLAPNPTPPPTLAV